MYILVQATQQDKARLEEKHEKISNVYTESYRIDACIKSVALNFTSHLEMVALTMDTLYVEQSLYCNSERYDVPRKMSFEKVQSLILIPS